jgi:dihydropteroate synthase
LLRHVGDLVSLGYPVVVGTSRKSFLGRVAPGPDGAVAPVEERLAPSLATAAWAFAAGALMVRAHDVAPTVRTASIVGTTVGVPVVLPANEPVGAGR